MSLRWDNRTFAGWVARRADPELAAAVEAWPTMAESDRGGYLGDGEGGNSARVELWDGAETTMIDPDQIAEIAETLHRIVWSDSDNAWEKGQAPVAEHNEDEVWKALCAYAEAKITEHKGDQFTGEATAWSKVLGIIKSVP